MVGKHFYTFNICGKIFSREKLDPKMANHEYNLYYATTKNVVYFYVWYLVEWFVKWIFYRDGIKAYYEISFEREA